MNIVQTNAPKGHKANSSSMTVMPVDGTLNGHKADRLLSCHYAPNVQNAKSPIMGLLSDHYAPKGQGALSPGQRPGVRDGHRHTPCKGKSLVMHIMLLPLQGANHNADTPRALPWAMCRLPLRGESGMFALSQGDNCRLPLQGENGMFALSDGAKCRLPLRGDSGRKQDVCIVRW